LTVWFEAVFVSLVFRLVFLVLAWDSVSVDVVDLEVFAVEAFDVVSELLADWLSVVALVSFVPLFEALMSPEFDVLLLVVVAASVLELPLVELPADPVPVVASALD
jgi:hypothetical protein